MKYLTNKKLWAAIIGLITALGTFMVTLDEAKADAGTPGYTPRVTYYAVDCASNPEYGAKVDATDDPWAGSIMFRTAFTTTGSSQYLEVWIVVKVDESDPSTWYYLTTTNPSNPNNLKGTLSSTPKRAFVGTITSSTTTHILMEIYQIYKVYGSYEVPDQVCFIYDHTVNNSVNLDCIAVSTL